jgi:hypothetical protein
MDWTAQSIAYCERTDFTYWSEPVNAITNASFLIAAAIMAYRLRGQRLPLAWALVAVLAAIGIGSYLWHTHATRWAGTMDVLPILFFILIYVYAASRDYLELRWYFSLVGVARFFPYAFFVTAGLSNVFPGIGANAAYAAVLLLILDYALILSRRSPATARGLAIGAGILALSLTFRALDGPVCEVFPIGTHFMWHVLNGVMLGWMIEVYRRHMTARA